MWRLPGQLPFLAHGGSLSLQSCNVHSWHGGGGGGRAAKDPGGRKGKKFWLPWFQDKFKDLGKHVVAFIGATEVAKTGDPKMVWGSAIEIFQKKPKDITYTVDKMFIHPLLGTSQDHLVNPDLALARLSRPVPAFSDFLRPICLARPEGEERPSCPDSSIDRGEGEMRRED